jgi:hypothetical protein
MADPTLPVFQELGFDQELVDLINQERAKVGAIALNQPDRIDDAADAHALDMAQNNNLSLDGSDGSTSSSRIKDTGYLFANVGETIAIGDTAAEVVETWMNDPTQRSLILNPTFQDTGVGTVLDNNGVLFWSQVFGGPDPAPAPAPDPITGAPDPMAPTVDPITPDPITPDPMAPTVDPIAGTPDPMTPTVEPLMPDPVAPTVDPISPDPAPWKRGMCGGRGKGRSHDLMSAPENPMGHSDIMGGGHHRRRH